jgi:kynureninase
LLGPSPKGVAARVANTIEEEWGFGLIHSSAAGWYDASGRIGAKLASILGAAPHQRVGRISEVPSSLLFLPVLLAAGYAFHQGCGGQVGLIRPTGH